MNSSIIIITLIIFIDGLSYGTYELKKKNKLGGISIFLLSTLMFIFVNYAMISFK